MAHGSFGSRHGQFRSHAARFLIPSRTLGFSNETLKPGGPLYLKPQADSDQLVLRSVVASDDLTLNPSGATRDSTLTLSRKAAVRKLWNVTAVELAF